MKIGLVVCVLTSSFIYVYGQSGLKKCTRPNGDEGLCIRYDQCPEMQTRNTHTRELASYFCGYDGSIHKLCCDYDCYTPEGNLGKCKHVNLCPHLLEMSKSTDKNNRTFVRHSRCLTGGDEPALDEYPWLVLLEHRKELTGQIKTLCGGALISNRYVVTAAHCISGPGAWPPIRVRLGEHDTSTDIDCVDDVCADAVQTIRIEEIIIHPEYRPRSKRHDIALLRLSSPVSYTNYIRPICLPDTNVLRSDDLKAYVAGWGKLNTTNIRSEVKQHVKIPIVKKEDCEKAFSSLTANPPKLSGMQLCAGGEAGKDSCNGDSGGPLMLKTGLTHELVGVVSFGLRECGTEGVPGVYTHVYAYSVWILRNIRP